MRVERTETKYMLNVDQYSRLIESLPKLLEADKHNGDYGYRIMSLYFDSVFNTDYYAKVDGIENRKKVRLRYYGDASNGVKLEVKIKRNTYQAKESIMITEEDAKRLQAGDFDCLYNYKEPLAEEIRRLMVMGCYRPVVRIEYLRKAYISDVNTTRITFDSELRVSESSLNLFGPRDELHRIPDQYFAILEVKSTGELPGYIKKQLATLSESSRAISKYREARWFFEEINLI